MVKLNYDTPIEVSQATYKTMMEEFAEIIAGQVKNGKCYIKLWDMRWKKIAQKRLNKLIRNGKK